MSVTPVVLDVEVPARDRGYPVLVGDGLLSSLGSEVRRRVPKARRAVLVSDSNVMPLHGGTARQSLAAADLEVVECEVPAGEASKSIERLGGIVTTMLGAGVGRADVLVTLGGGVVGDLGGFAASVFMRGIEFVQCPTSLLAQVDASVGGKVAVNVPQGKNLVGAFHFPRMVVADPAVLVSLPDRELACGLAEMAKHGALFSAAHLRDLVDHADAVYRRDRDVLSRLVATSVGLKAACVSRDPREENAAGEGRVLLNLGHTVGHALEAASEYALLHGEAVALGLCAAARLSVARGLADADLEAAMLASLGSLRLPTGLDAWLQPERIPSLTRAMGHDKKRRGGTLTYIALEQFGGPVTLQLRPEKILSLLRR